MLEFIGQIKVKVSDKVFLKDPDSSDLGRSIIEHSIQLIHEIGFECFTFKKLGKQIGSPESTIYRYFENKHKLLLYLTAWYWAWLEYRLVFATANIDSAEERLKIAVEILTNPIQEDGEFAHVNEVILNQIVIAESFKAYHTRNVDEENKEGCFMVYKKLIKRVSEMVLAVNPEFKYPNTLISTVIEGAHHQEYFSRHLSFLTDKKKGEEDISEFFTHLVFNTIKTSQ